MRLHELRALRAISTKTLVTRWRPLDVACEGDDGERVVRAKLVRCEDTAAVCLVEAVAHEVLRVVGLAVADAHAMTIDTDFAADLTRQFKFDTPVRPGRHWATTLLLDCATEVEFDHDHLKHLGRQADIVVTYLADILLANPDRRTMGNVLLRRTDRVRTLTVVPIDQSDCFNHPACVRDRQCLAASRTERCAQWLDGTESVVLDLGSGFIRGEIARFRGLTDEILEATSVPPDEWYEQAGVAPSDLRDFLAHRLQSLETLADVGFWDGIVAATGGGHVLNI